MLLVKTSEALLQMKWLLGTRWSVLRVIYHFTDLDGSLHSRDEHEVRMEFHTMGISEETWTCEDEKATDAQNLGK